MFMDTLKAQTTTWLQQNKYMQVFSTSFGWARAYLMKRKSDTHKGFSFLAQCDGVPITIICDNAKEQIMGKFCCKCCEVGMHVKQTKPYTPWSNVAEGTIHELKCRAGQKMAKSSCPAKLWDHCLDLEAYIRSHTALDKYELQGQVPKTIVLGQTVDISPFIERPVYAWVKFWDNLAKYPEPKEQLSWWLGPAINIGPAMTAKILKSNGQVLYMSTYCGLTDDEHHDNAEVQKQKLFDSLIKSKLGSPLFFHDLQDLDPDITTPHYELYEDDFKTHNHVPDIDDDVNPEQGTHMLAEVSLPHGDSQQTGKVIHQARDQDSELTGTAHNNLILDTRSYQVEFLMAN